MIGEANNKKNKTNDGIESLSTFPGLQAKPALVELSLYQQGEELQKDI